MMWVNPDSLVFVDSSDEDIRRIQEMALGRLFLLGSRPEQPGDIEQYNKVRDVFMAAEDERKSRTKVKP